MKPSASISSTGTKSSLIDPFLNSLMPRPGQSRSQYDIHVFIGFANFYRRFIQSFSIISAPLTSMLRTGLPARLSENSTVVENDEEGDGGGGGIKRIDSHSTLPHAQDERTNWIIRKLDSDNGIGVEDDEVVVGGGAIEK